MEASGYKLCFKCGVDCAGKPRVKDAKGRYLCQACAAARHAPPAPARPAPPISAPPPSPASTPAIPVADDIIDLAAGPVPAPRAPRSPPPAAEIDLALAPEPVRTAPPRISRYEATVIAKGMPKKCARCGYSLKGLTELRCPECGEAITLRSDFDALEEDSREVTRWAYLRPTIILALGLIALVAVSLLRHGPSQLVVNLVDYAVSVPASLAAFYICAALFLGFDAPWYLTLLRLAGIFAVADAGYELLIVRGSFNISMPARLLYFGIVVVMLITELDLEKSDAWIMAFITSVLRIAIYVVLAVIIKQYF